MEAKESDSKRNSDGVSQALCHQNSLLGREPTASLKDRPGNGRPENRGGQNSRATKLIPLEQIPEAREMLLSVLDTPPAEVHAMSVRLRSEYPGRRPGAVLISLRHLRDDRGEARGKHATWSEEDLAILRAGYAAGPAGARWARKNLLKRHPDWNRYVLDYMAAELELTNQTPRAERWLENHQKELLWGAEETSVRQFAAKLGRSQAAIRNRLCLLGARGQVRVQEGYSRRRTAAILGVTHTTVRRWIARGLLRTSRTKEGHRTGYITEAALEAFCRQYPERVKAPGCATDAFQLLKEDREDEQTTVGAEWLHGRRNRPVCWPQNSRRRAEKASVPQLYLPASKV